MSTENLKLRTETTSVTCQTSYSGIRTFPNHSESTEKKFSRRIFSVDELVVFILNMKLLFRRRKRILKFARHVKNHEM